MLESHARSEGRSVVTPPIDSDSVENVDDDNVNNDNDLHVEDPHVTVRQSGRVRLKPAWMGENYQILRSVQARSCFM